MQRNLKCAYHQQQNLMNFCRAKQCLLPVCPSCIKLHMQNHLIERTSPQYQTIQQMFAQAQSSYSMRITQIEQLISQLMNIQKSKRENENMIRTKFIQFKNIIYRQFQRFMNDLEDQIILKFKKEDEKFIQNLQEIDEQMQIFYEKIKNQKKELGTYNGLKLLILHEDRLKQSYPCQISKFQNQVNELLTQSMYMSIDQSCIRQMKRCLQRYVKIQKMKWT